MNRLDTWKFAVAAGITFGALSIVCALAVVISPDMTIAFFSSFTHGIDLAALVPAGGRPVTVGQVIGGAIALAAIGFTAGAMLAGCYNLLMPRSSGDSLRGGRRLR